jgi:sortase A
MGISSALGLERSDTGLTKRRTRSAASTVLRLLQWLLLVTGITLLVVYTATQIDRAQGHKEALEAFAQARSLHIVDVPASVSPAPTSAPHENLGPPDQTLWGKARIAAYEEASRTHRDTPLGVLTISSITLEAPIFDGTSALALNRGIGRIEGTADVGAVGNLGLAAHRDGFFRGLKDVSVGDAIDLESLSGTTRYRITALSIVEPTDVHVLAPTDTATLTLVTCYPFYFIGEAPQRYIVKAVAESPAAIAVR